MSYNRRNVQVFSSILILMKDNGLQFMNKSWGDDNVQNRFTNMFHEIYLKWRYLKELRKTVESTKVK